MAEGYGGIDFSRLAQALNGNPVDGYGGIDYDRFRDAMVGTALIRKSFVHVYLDDAGRAIAVNEKGERVAGPSEDHAEVIQAAINALPDYGVLWTHGTFTISSEIVVKPRMFWLGGKFIVGPNARLVNLASDVEDVVLAGMYVDASQATLIPINFGGGYAARNVVLRDIVFVNGPDMEMVWIGGGERRNFIIENLRFFNVHKGVRSNTLSYSIVRNIVGYDVKRELVFIAGYSGGPYPHHNIIENVILVNETDVLTLAAQGYNPMVVDISASYAQIVRNIVGYNVVKGVNAEPLWESGMPEDQTIIENVRVERCYRSAVYITAAYRVTVRNVYAKDVGLVNDPNDPGIHGITFNAYYSTVEGSVVVRPRGHGIAVGAGRDQCIIKGNRIYEPNYEGAFSVGRAINIYNVRGCIITDNVIEGDGVKMHYGVYEDGVSDYNIIKNNVIRGYATAAVRQVGLNTVVADNVSY